MWEGTEEGNKERRRRKRMRNYKRKQSTLCIIKQISIHKHIPNLNSHMKGFASSMQSRNHVLVPSKAFIF
jgi:hypothetical protein